MKLKQNNTYLFDFLYLSIFKYFLYFNIKIKIIQNFNYEQWDYSQQIVHIEIFNKYYILSLKLFMYK